MPVNIPTSLLRSFVAIVDTGTMLHASEAVYITQSALSLQIKRLEEMVQQTLFLRDGRRLKLTPSGALMLDYARRLLTLHDEAVMAVSAGQLSGPIRIGMVQDFAELLLSGLLYRFNQRHSDTQIYSRIAGTGELLALLGRGQLDIVIGFGAEHNPDAVTETPIGWYGNPSLVEQTPLPLAVLETPCLFRDIALRSLDEVGLTYRVAVETPDLTTLRASVQAGLGITCRTLFSMEAPIIVDSGLPELPNVFCTLLAANGLDRAAAHFAELARENIAALGCQD